MSATEQQATGHDPAAIGIDWGTTRARAYLMDATGAVVATRDDGRGTLSLAADADAFSAECERLVGDWARAHAVPIVACGMVGSDQGWTEAPYRDLPAAIAVDAAEARVVHASFGDVHILAGLRREAAGDRWPDVMRGEETQLLGALEPKATALVVLPGTHTKWVDVVDGVVVDFTTTMAGELRALLLEHGIVGRLADAHEHDAPAAFARGLDAAEAAARRGTGLLESAFSARTLAMSGALGTHEIRDYVSGLVIGADVGARARAGAVPTVVCGSPALTTRYAAALERHDVEAHVVPTAATPLGLWRASIALGLQGAPS